MTDSSHKANLSIDAILVIGVDDHKSAVSMKSITAGSSAAEEDPNNTSASFDVNEEDNDGASGGSMAGVAASASVQTFHGHTHMIGPQVIHHNNVVDKNAWYVRIGFPRERMRKDGKFTCSNNITSLQEQSSQKRPAGRQTTISSMPLPQHVVHKHENAVVDFIIGGYISLHAAGEKQFYKLVETLASGCYKPPSTRTVLRRTVEFFIIAQPLLAKFLCSLGTCVSLTVDCWWSICNLKGFYVVTAHWIDTTSGMMKSLLLTILDVSSGTGVGN
jgi:hypothetical protein